MWSAVCKGLSESRVENASMKMRGEGRCAYLDAVECAARSIVVGDDSKPTDREGVVCRWLRCCGGELNSGTASIAVFSGGVTVGEGKS